MWGNDEGKRERAEAGEKSNERYYRGTALGGMIPEQRARASRGEKARERECRKDVVVVVVAGRDEGG